MHINQRTKGFEYCTAESMLLGMLYGWMTHVYFKQGKGSTCIDAETLQPLTAREVNQRGQDYISIFKYKTNVPTALQYLKDYGPKP
jgi:hypothetical protein